MGMAAAAVELVKETLPFRGAVRVLLKWALIRFRQRLAARKDRAEHRLLRPRRRHREILKRAYLSLARKKAQCAKPNAQCPTRVHRVPSVSGADPAGPRSTRGT